MNIRPINKWNASKYPIKLYHPIQAGFYLILFEKLFKNMKFISQKVFRAFRKA